MFDGEKLCNGAKNARCTVYHVPHPIVPNHDRCCIFVKEICHSTTSLVSPFTAHNSDGVQKVLRSQGYLLHTPESITFLTSYPEENM